MSKYHKIFIPHRFPCRNQQEAAARSNRFAAASMKKKYTEIARVYFAKYGVQNIGLSEFTFTWIEPNRKKDPDNISGGVKFIFDGMQKAGFLKNDGWKNVAKISHKFLTSSRIGVFVDVVDLWDNENAVIIEL